MIKTGILCFSLNQLFFFLVCELHPSIHLRAFSPKNAHRLSAATLVLTCLQKFHRLEAMTLLQKPPQWLPCSKLIVHLLLPQQWLFCILLLFQGS